MEYKLDNQPDLCARARWSPLKLGLFVSVLMALPASLLVFATNVPFAKVLIEVVYPLPALLLDGLDANPNLVCVPISIIYGQFFVYGVIISFGKSRLNRRRAVWALTFFHAAAGILAILYGR